MGDVGCGRVRGGLRAAGFALAAMVLGAAPGRGIDLADGKIQIHGTYEAQIRSIMRDYNSSQDWDLTQWWNVLTLEIDAPLFPNGVGPFDLVSAFGRIEVRYDCVWTRACGIFESADAYGPRARKLPQRLVDARRSGYEGTLWVGDQRHYYDVPYVDVNVTPDDHRLRPSGQRAPMAFFQTPLGASFFGSNSYGLDGIPQTADDLGNLYFEKMLRPHCNLWGVRNRPHGTQNGLGNSDSLILDTACDYDAIGADANTPNPFRPGDVNPVTGLNGALALPYRPAPRLDFESGAPLAAGARGVFYPNPRLQQLLDEGELKPIHTEFRRAEMAWNHGQSQEEQKELKELYVDLEMLDSRLWVRAGYQTIVWGKTELFRNQDQFNPQDVALGSLTSLEESRISLWAIRGVWSFYDVGPLNDVRLEVAVNIDQFEPTDLGTCGEPYTVLAACAISVGQIAHGYYGIGLAGEIRPEDPWESWKGLEGGARLEFRWDRYSFAITDFYGFQDFPFIDTVWAYARNVDPRTGRIRHTTSTGSCRTGKEPACLDAANALEEQAANQQLFALVCATTVGLAPTLDPTSCFANVFGSPNRTGAPGEVKPRVVVALDLIGRGDPGPEGTVLPGLAEYPAGGSVQDTIGRFTYNGARKVTVDLNVDSNDGGVDFPAGHPLLSQPDFNETVAFFHQTLGGSLSARLTDQQEALIGCGKFFHTSCDLDGIDLLNAEASALLQSWPDVAGTFNPDTSVRWDTTNKHVTQPGTVGFGGGPLCTRYEGGKTFVLPGCRGPGDPGYDPRVDGTISGLRQPFTGQQFENEMAAFSWNLLMGLVGFSLAPRDFGQTTGPRHAARPQDFDPNDPFRQGGCSFREPQWCGNVTSFLALTGQRRNDMMAGGNGTFGRRDFVWHSGGMGVARYDKSNILGFSMDFAEDTTKSNWGVEFTWVEGLHVADNNAFSGTTPTNSYRLTISVDRPTFVNFLNANRTFFINSQWFFEYEDGTTPGFTSNAPWDIFGVISIDTGYFQDRLLPGIVGVYFVRDNSFAVLPQITYRYNENFSATFGLAAFAGREQRRPMPIQELAPASERFGRSAYTTSVENGLAIIRERDEIFLRIKYTF